MNTNIIHIIPHICDGEVYVLVYQNKTYFKAIKAIAKWICNPNLSFGMRDAAKMYKTMQLIRSKT